MRTRPGRGRAPVWASRAGRAEQLSRRSARAAVKWAGMCWTMTMAKRVSAGRAGMRWLRATGPPVETAMTHSLGRAPPVVMPGLEGLGVAVALEVNDEEGAA